MTMKTHAPSPTKELDDLWGHVLERVHESEDRMGRLTAREIQVLQLSAEGYTYADIAREIFLAPDTVRTHMGKAIKKTGAHNKTEAVAVAIRAGVIT